MNPASMDQLERYATTAATSGLEEPPPSYDRTKSYISLESYAGPVDSNVSFALKPYLPFAFLPAVSVASGTDNLQRYPNPSDILDTYLEPQPSLPHVKPEVSVAVQPQPSSASVPQKRGRKPKSASIPSRHENKMNRNSNKSYVNYKGVEIKPRKFNNFQCKCVKKCSRRLSAADRLSEFEKFWALSAYDAQTAFIAAKVTEHPVKKRYGKSDSIKKDFSRTYSLCSSAVCRDMFCRTLQISSGRINTALTKIRTRTTIKDQRGIKKASESNAKYLKNKERKRAKKNLGNCINSSENKEQYVHMEKLVQFDIDAATVPLSQTFCSVMNDRKTEYIVSGSTGTSSDILTNADVPNSASLVYTSFVNTGNIHLPPLSTVPTSSTMHNCSIGFTESSDNLPNNVTTAAESPVPMEINNDGFQSKKGRKPKYNQSRLENKVNRNNNKAYINYKGVLVEPKKFIDFHCECSKKCFQNLSSGNRFTEFEKFWSLPYNSQTAYIVAAVSEQPVKRRYSQENETKKDFTRKYALGSVAVCREMFCRTLHISPGRINTALKKYRLRSALTDQRGIKQGGHNKLPADKRNCVIRFIKRIPVYKSHYCKEKSKSRFLPPELTLTKLYELYKEEEKDNAVSNASFKKIFYNSFNLRAKETCHECEMWSRKLRKEQNELKKLEIKQMYDEHRVTAEKAQKYLEHDMLCAKKYPEVECVTFDMERTLPLPRVPTNIMCYKRLLWLYNIGIYSSKKDQSYCYVWPEGQAGKGAQEVGSCLLKHAKEEIVWSPDVSHLILWTDSCGGLNRNIKLTLMLKSLLQSCPTLKTIKLKFLVTGHCSLPNQRDFSDIERTLKTHTHLYTTDDYVNLMRYCRKKKPLIVKSMSNQEFIGTEQLEKHIVNSKIKADNVNWSDIREISMFVHDPYTIYFKTDFEGQTISMDIRPIPDMQQVFNFMHLLVPLWPLGKPITPAKLKDIKSMLHLIPTHAKSFYSNLQCGSHNDEDVDGFNEELDFEVEYSHK